MLKQSKIWQRGKPKFDTSQSGTAGLPFSQLSELDPGLARQPSSCLLQFWFWPQHWWWNPPIKNIGPRQAKTNTNKYTLIGSRTGDSSRGNGVRPRVRVAQKCNHQIGVASFKIQSSALLWKQFSTKRVQKSIFCVLVWKMHVVSHFGPRKLYRHLIKFALLI